MKTRIHVAANRWGKDLSYSNEKSTNPYLIPLGAFEINLPDDIMPDDATFTAMSYRHEIECKEREVNEMRKHLLAAERELAEMRALPPAQS